MSALVGALRAMLTLDSTAFVAGSGKAQSASKANAGHISGDGRDGGGAGTGDQGPVERR
jgi:hypothetical protein